MGTILGQISVHFIKMGAFLFGISVHFSEVGTFFRQNVCTLGHKFVPEPSIMSKIHREPFPGTCTYYPIRSVHSGTATEFLAANIFQTISGAALLVYVTRPVGKLNAINHRNQRCLGNSYLHQQDSDKNVMIPVSDHE